MPSSVIRHFHYDADAARLDVTFVGGRVYAYHAVPAEVVAGMRAAFSKGEYFNAEVKDRYAFTRVG